jgi:hypothetical protein
VSGVDCETRTIFVADAHCGDGKRFVVHTDEKLAALLEFGIGDSRHQEMVSICQKTRCRIAAANANH